MLGVVALVVLVTGIETDDGELTRFAKIITLIKTNLNIFLYGYIINFKAENN